VNLIAVHRLLIQVFAVAALVFGGLMTKRWSAGEPNGSLAGAIVAFGLALGAVVYLFRAPHLRKK
jgi:hypothetical protein